MLIDTDFPDPVVPATSRCGIRARSAITGSPPIVLPRQSPRRDLVRSKSSAKPSASNSRRYTVSRRAFGSSMPMAFLPGITATRQDPMALIERAMSSASPITRADLMPGAGSFVERNHRPRAHIDDLAANTEIVENALEKPSILFQRVGVDGRLAVSSFWVRQEGEAAVAQSPPMRSNEVCASRVERAFPERGFGDNRCRTRLICLAGAGDSDLDGSSNSLQVREVVVFKQRFNPAVIERHRQIIVPVKSIHARTGDRTPRIRKPKWASAPKRTAIRPMVRGRRTRRHPLQDPSSPSSNSSSSVSSSSSAIAAGRAGRRVASGSGSACRGHAKTP